MKIIVIIIIVSMVILAGCSYEDTGGTAIQEDDVEELEKNGRTEMSGQEQGEDTAEDEVRPPVQDILDGFEKRLIQETDEDYKVKDFTTRQQLIEHISQVAVTTLAEEYVDRFYEIKDGELYIIPRDGPMLIDTGEDYQLEKINPLKYRVVQSGENELWGEYTVETIVEEINGKWLISQINTEAN